jgi:hypothetical protein
MTVENACFPHRALHSQAWKANQFHALRKCECGFLSHSSLSRSNTGRLLDILRLFGCDAFQLLSWDSDWAQSRFVLVEKGLKRVQASELYENAPERYYAPEFEKHSRRAFLLICSLCNDSTLAGNDSKKVGNSPLSGT